MNLLQYGICSLLSILSINCNEKCRFKGEGYTPQEYTLSILNNVLKNKYICPNKSRQVVFSIEHSCHYIDSNYYIILISSGDILICEKYKKDIQVEIDQDYFKSGKNFQIELFDPALNKMYIWSKDSPVYIKQNAKQISITLFKELSFISEFKVKD